MRKEVLPYSCPLNFLFELNRVFILSISSIFSLFSGVFSCDFWFARFTPSYRNHFVGSAGSRKQESVAQVLFRFMEVWWSNLFWNIRSFFCLFVCSCRSDCSRVPAPAAAPRGAQASSDKAGHDYPSLEAMISTIHTHLLKIPVINLPTHWINWPLAWPIIAIAYVYWVRKICMDTHYNITHMHANLKKSYNY